MAQILIVQYMNDIIGLMKYSARQGDPMTLLIFPEGPPTSRYSFRRCRSAPYSLK
jgi:hypothetical protein